MKERLWNGGNTEALLLLVLENINVGSEGDIEQTNENMKKVRELRKRGGGKGREGNVWKYESGEMRGMLEGNNEKMTKTKEIKNRKEGGC